MEHLEEPLVDPVVIADWWCTRCGRGEADERTRLCRECAYMQGDAGAKIGTEANDTRRSVPAAAYLAEVQEDIRSIEASLLRVVPDLEEPVRLAVTAVTDAMRRAGEALAWARCALAVAILARRTLPGAAAPGKAEGH